MRGMIRRLDGWGEARPWLTATGAGGFLAVVLAAIEWGLDDTPDWLFVILLSVVLTVVWGFKGQAQRRRRQG
jgi:hypothetical protein